jgi:hypothetical protein
MNNPITHKLCSEIQNAQMSITGGHADVKDIWVLLDQIEQHLRENDAVHGQVVRLFSKIGIGRVRIGNAVVPPALTGNGISFIEYSPLDD